MRIRARRVQWFIGSVLCLLVLLPLDYPAGSAGVAEAALFKVTLEITNTSVHIGGSTYTLSDLTFKEDGMPIGYTPALYEQVIAPQETKTLGPFFMHAMPDQLTMEGTKTFSHPPFNADVSFTVSPLDSDAPYDIENESLRLTAHITEVLPIPSVTAAGGIVLSLLLAGSGLFLIRRRQKTA